MTFKMTRNRWCSF